MAGLRAQCDLHVGDGVNVPETSLAGRDTRDRLMYVIHVCSHVKETYLSVLTCGFGLNMAAQPHLLLVNAPAPHVISRLTIWEFLQ